jgi:hypothetical protein
MIERDKSGKLEAGLANLRRIADGRRTQGGEFEYESCGTAKQSGL